MGSHVMDTGRDLTQIKDVLLPISDELFAYMPLPCRNTADY